MQADTNTTSTLAEQHRIASREEWLHARRALLAKEKQATHLRDSINAERMALPWVRLEQDYAFDTPAGRKSLGDLFDGRSQLIIYHFMLGPDWAAGCPGCSFLADHLDGALPHLLHHDVTLVAVSRAPLARIEEYKARMGWRFPWVSSFGSGFNFDFHVSFTAEQLAKGTVFYNFAQTDAARAHDELPGLSAFHRNAAGEVFHTYSSYARGPEELIGTLMILDRAPRGRNEKTTMDFVRRHDEYENEPSAVTRNVSPATRWDSVGDVLQDHVARGQVAGALALLSNTHVTRVEVAGVQDIAAGTPMRRDTIFRIASMTKPVTAAAAMLLVEEGRIALHDPAERWLPELANRRVLRSIDSALDDTVPARRPITLDDLLTFRLGLGAVMAPPDRYPIQSAIAELGVAPGPHNLPFGPDEFMARIGRLPLIHQPGERWMYHTGADIVTVLIARIAGMPLEAFLRERIFAPLGMHDTGFSVPERSWHRLATCYAADEAGGLSPWDGAGGASDTRPPAFPNALVSTADDYLAFARMLLDQGRCGRRQVLARESIARMMRDHIGPEQKAASPFFPGFWDHHGWGYGGAVVTNRIEGGAGPGSYGWMGGFDTSFLVDPELPLVTIVLSQRLMRGPADVALTADVQSRAYGAVRA